jgi:mannan endo-1,4-beta-mannosidase
MSMTDFVHTNGTGFEAQGQPLTLVGANNYYLAYASNVMVEAVFALAAKMNINVLRTWAFLDCGVAQLGSTPAGASSGVYFHYWNSTTNQLEVNDGPNGLEHLDQVIALAEKYNMRLILPLANNWPNFGGIDQYLKWFGIKGHDQFFRNSEVKQAYKDYVEHLLLRVNTRTGRRYTDEPAVLAWELMNEPRCVDDDGHAVPDGVDTLTAWVDEMSTYVKTLDSNHLTSVGDEGFFRRSLAGSNTLYNGSYGVDCEQILGAPTIDFGTCHLYPSLDANGSAVSFGQRWIREHIEAGQRAQKPMLIEEYGYQIDNIEEGRKQRDGVFKAWLDQVLESDGSGAALWMIASLMDNGQLYPDYDHYTVYAAEDVPSILAFSSAANADPHLQSSAAQP